MMKAQRAGVWITAVVLALGALGCGEDGEQASSDESEGSATAAAETSQPAPAAAALPPAASSCNRIAMDRVCTEYRGTVATEDSMRNLCGVVAGNFAQGSCPAEGLVGRCVQYGGTANEQHELFYPPMTEDAARQRCRGEFRTH